MVTGMASPRAPPCYLCYMEKIETGRWTTGPASGTAVQGWWNRVETVTVAEEHRYRDSDDETSDTVSQCCKLPARQGSVSHLDSFLSCNLSHGPSAFYCFVIGYNMDH